MANGHSFWAFLYVQNRQDIRGFLSLVASTHNCSACSELYHGDHRVSHRGAADDLGLLRYIKYQQPR